jgi:DNA topoisomerase-3
MRVCIAEKPSVAGEIAKIIGANVKRNGYYEGNGYAVTWTFGHLCTLNEPEDYNPNNKKWDLYNLPISPDKFGIKLIKDNGVEKQFNVIKELVAKCSEVINCGDAGQEGELIQRWVLQHADCKVPIKRLWISSLTEEAIKDGFKKLMDGKDFDNLFEAGKCRAIGDWLYGINATRLYTVKFGKPKEILSVGRVQTPTLAMIVRRHFEIKNFVPKDFFEIKTIYRETTFSSSTGRFEIRKDAEKVLEGIQNYPLVIEKIETKKGKENPLPLFDLTSLQVEANKKMGYSADQTLKIIQNLYEKKLVTYPRVDTVYLPKDQYSKIPGILKGLIHYTELVNPLLQKPIKKSDKVFNDNKVTDHHAIIPTGVPATAINSDETAIYDLIARRFIAAFYPECLVSNTTVEAKVDKYNFKATGKQILDEGWRVVYAHERKKDVKKDEMPLFVKGESGPHQPSLETKQTSPPKEYTEATLLRAMETAGKQVDNEELKQLMKENGIGRPSTRANIIETLFKRKYITKKKKNLIPTELGIALVQTIENPTLKSAELTGQWEKKIRDIENGKYNPDDFILEMKKMVDDLVKEVIYPKTNQKIRCPKCEVGWIVKGNKAYGCSEWKNGCDFTVPLEMNNIEVSAEALHILINHKDVVIHQHQKENHLILDNYFKTHLISAEDLICPKCKQGEIKKGTKAWGCSLYKKSCDFLLPYNLFSSEPNRLQIKELLKNKFIDLGKHRISIAEDGGIEKNEIDNSNNFFLDNEEDED